MNPTVEPSFDALDRLPTAWELPSDDGEPLETSWHRPAMNVLIDSLEHHWRGRKDFFVGGNMFLYFSRERVFNKDFRGPDFFVVLGVEHDKERPSWVAWEEDGKLPHVIIELSSESTAKIDRNQKWALYRDRLETPAYLIYDPETGGVEGFHRLNGHVEPVEVEPGGRVWCRPLELYFGPWEGVFQGHFNRWPRFFDVHGNLIPTAAEAETARAEQEKQRADAAAVAANAEKQRADAAEAELARLRAELAALRNPPQH